MKHPVSLGVVDVLDNERFLWHRLDIKLRLGHRTVNRVLKIRDHLMIGHKRMKMSRPVWAVVLVLAGIVQGQQSPRTFALKAESPEFWKLIDHDAKLETVAAGFGF